jgi:hypothetical protein
MVLMPRRYTVKILTLAAVLAVAVALFVGWEGALKTTRLSAGSCAASYPTYVVSPYLQSLVRCGSLKDCSTDTALARYRAALSVTRCLCADVSANARAITDFAQTNLVSSFTREPFSTDAPAVCTSVTEAGEIP